MLVRYSLGTLSCLLLFVCAVGCEKSADVGEVTGTVMLGDKPLELVHVEFWPTAGMRSFGKTDESGRFVLRLDDDSAAGAVPGTHKVILRDTWPTKDDVLGPGGDWIDNSQGKKPRISSIYYDIANTPLQFTVELGKPNHFDITVQPRK